MTTVMPLSDGPFPTDGPCVIEETRYLRFDFRTSKSRRTVTVLVSGKRSGLLLGAIKWHRDQHEYFFGPLTGSLFNREYMIDILTVMAVLRRQRKKLKGK